MRDYLAAENFRRALLLGGGATLLAVPRLVQAGLASATLLGATFAGMTLVAGAATAWSRHARMHGVLPSRRRVVCGTAVAVLVGALFVPVLLKIDPALHQALDAGGHARLAALAFPQSVPDAWALILWGAGVETLLFQAGALAFFARLTDNRPISLAAATLLRGFVAYGQFAHAGLTDALPLVVAAHLGRALVGCVLYASAGMPAAAAFSATVDARHLALE